jgi:hypothetical protein
MLGIAERGPSHGVQDPSWCGWPGIRSANPWMADAAAARAFRALSTIPALPGQWAGTITVSMTNSMASGPTLVWPRSG